MDQLDGVGWTLAGAGAAALAQCRIYESCSTQAADPWSSFLRNNQRDFERAGTHTGQAADTFIRINFGDHASQVERLLGKQSKARPEAASAWLMLSSINFG